MNDLINPIEIDYRTGRIKSGHARLEALRQMHDAGNQPPYFIRVDTSGDWLVPAKAGQATVYIVLGEAE